MASREFRGKTLDVLGIKTAPIIDVFSLEPVQLPVVAERLDVIFVDKNMKYYHLEEQRNMKTKDMYRFASTYFQIVHAKGEQVTDIILCSGRKYKGIKEIIADSGTYKPIIIDFTNRDGYKRLNEIRNEIERNDLTNLVELVFIPLYGDDSAVDKSELTLEVLDFQIELVHQQKMPLQLLAATMIMANKMVDPSIISKIMEDMSMFDLFEIVREKFSEEARREGKREGKKAGKKEGKKEGMLESARAILTDTLKIKFNEVSQSIIVLLQEIKDYHILQNLHREAIICTNINDFQLRLEALRRI